MPSLVPTVDPDGLLEYSVVYTDRAVNHMSKQFQGTMTGLSATLKAVYAADAVAIVPGSGTSAMEAVARQLAQDRKALVIRNGLFSFRWSQIFDAGRIPAETVVLKARRTGEGPTAPFAPVPIAEAVAAIRAAKPDVVFAPHVETSAGIMLPEGYMAALAAAVHAHGGLLVIDGIASGTVWVDMRALGIDVFISAPQKGWSGPACAGIVLMNDRAVAAVEASPPSTSFTLDLKKWLAVMKAYEGGGHMYHATMPTDALGGFWRVVQETQRYGFDRVKSEQLELGQRVYSMLADRGVPVAAAPGFEAPGVVVCYSDEKDLPRRFAAAGLQIAAGVPLQCDEGSEFQTFRLGLFGLDKLHNAERTIESLEEALDVVMPDE